MDLFLFELTNLNLINGLSVIDMIESDDIRLLTSPPIS